MSIRIVMCAICVTFSIRFAAISSAETQSLPPANAIAQDDPITAPFWRAMERGNGEEAVKAFAGENAKREYVEKVSNVLPGLMAKAGKCIDRVEITRHTFDNRLLYTESLAQFDHAVVLVELVYLKVGDHWMGINFNIQGDGDNLRQHVAEAAKREASKHDEKGK